MYNIRYVTLLNRKFMHCFLHFLPFFKCSFQLLFLKAPNLNAAKYMAKVIIVINRISKKLFCKPEPAIFLGKNDHGIKSPDLNDINTYFLNTGYY